MGTDITTILEIPTDYDTVDWQTLSKFYLKRNYEVFRLLFGVRNAIDDPYFTTRGLADNLSFVTRNHLMLSNNSSTKLQQKVFVKDSQGDVVEVNPKNAGSYTKTVRKTYSEPPVGHNHTYILAEELEDFSFESKTGRKIMENMYSDDIEKENDEDEVYRDVLGEDWVNLFESALRAKALFGNARIIIWFDG